MISDRNAIHIKSRGQSAMEYLITYGWAILLVAIIVSLLYLYVVVPHVIVPSSCSFVSGAYCNDIVLGSNSITHATKIGLFLTNTQPYPIENPILYANINSANTTQYTCKPSFIFPGGSIICIANITQTTTLGQFLAGTLYLKALYCGFAATPTSPQSCTATAPTEIYSGKFNAHAEPLVSTTSSITLTAKNTTNPGNPANNAKDPLYATVKLLGYPLHGATVNFIAYYSNGTNATPPYSISPAITTTGTSGVADSAIWGDVTGNVIVEASYAGYNATVPIRFIPTVHVTFNVSYVKSYLSNSDLPIINIAGTNYNYTQLQKSFVWGCGSSHPYAFVKIPYNSSGTRSVFKSVTIDGLTYTSTTGTVNVTCTNQTISTSYFTQYYFNEIANASTSGTVSPGDEWENASTSILISEAPNTGFFFKNWTCSGSGCYAGTATSTTVTLNNPITEQANFYSTSTSTTTTSTSTSSTTSSTSSTTTTTSTTSQTSTSTSTTSTSTSTTTTSTTTSTSTSTTTSSTTTTTSTTSQTSTSTSTTSTSTSTTTTSTTSSTSTTTSSTTSTTIAYLYSAGGYAADTSETSAIYYAPIYPNGSLGAWQTSSTSLPANLSLSTSYPSVQCGVYSGYLFCEDIFKGLNSYPYLQVWSAPINPNGMLGAFTVAYSGLLPYGSTAPDGCFTTAEGYMYCFETGTPPNGAYEMIIDLSTSGSATQASQNFTQWYPIELYGDVTLYCATHNYGDYVMYCTGGSFGTTNVYGLKTNGGKLVPLITNASYPIAVGGAACNVLNGYIYCVGDINASTSSQMQAIYSDSTNGDTLNSWGPPEENNYPIPTADMGCTIFNSNWYCVGGNGWNTQNDESYFAPLTTGGVGTWNQVTTFPESIFFNYVFAVTASTTTSTSTTISSSCSIYGSSRVLLANGTYIAASQLKPGMAIMSYNPASNITQPSIISDILKGHALNRYIFNNNLTVDSQETMLINGRWMLAGNSKVGDMVYDPLTKHNVPITSINISYNGGTVYDIYDQPINNFITYGGYVVDLVTSSTKSGCSVVGYDAIELANGSYVPASEIKVGQSLMSYNLKNKSAAPTVVTGIKSFNVTQTYIINNNLTIDASETLLVNGNFTTAANLKIGDYLFSPLSGKNVKVTSLNIVNSTSRVYDIDTAPIDAYIANGYMIT